MSGLGKWAVIDIETTGLDPLYDQVIDIGYYQFENSKLVKTYSSLIRTDIQLSQYIQKLTGISQRQIDKAPHWSKVCPDLLALEGHALLAHNARFEESFLSKYFEELGRDRDLETFQESMYLLSLVFPERGSLNLEGLLVDLALADKEEHRGLADSRDLLKVMLLSSKLVHRDKELKKVLNNILFDFSQEEFWAKNFLKLTEDELDEVADGINFDLDVALENYLGLKGEEKAEKREACDEKALDFSGQNIKMILRNEELLKTCLPGYKYRASQEQLSLRVGQSFQNNIHAIIQAPTGTGKTLGYLLPAVLLAKSKGEQVMISTGTKALQSQAMAKDIPLIYKMLGLGKHDLRVTRLVGSSNHYCELIYRNEKVGQDSMLDFRGFDDRFTQAYFEMVFFYNHRVSDYTKIITRDTVPFILKKKLDKFSEAEKEYQVDYRACTGHKCPYKEGCTYIQGMRLARESDLIVGNHSLLLSWPKSMERPRYIIVDEAHKIEGESTQAFTKELGQSDLDNFAKNMGTMVAPVFYLLNEEEHGKTAKILKKEVANAQKVIAENILGLEEHIERLAKALPRYTDIYWNEFPMIQKSKMNKALEVSLYNTIDSLRYIFKGVYESIFPLVEKWNISDLKDDNEIAAYTLFESFVGHLEHAVETLESLLSADKDYANSLKYHDEQGYALCSAPINVGEIFFDKVMKDSDSIVFTSATLANFDGSKGMSQIEWMTGHNMLSPERRFKSGFFLDNNYDYKNRAKVFLATDTLNLYDHDFVKNILEKLIPLVRDIGGRTLLLFSARSRFEKACEKLLKSFEGEMPLFIQGLGQNVVEDFKKSQKGLLIGMESFGEGIDIPGEALELVYIDKVPDLRQDIVTQQRRDFYESNFGNEFTDYFLAHRTRSLHQKLGRLMRRETDRGCVIVTDARIKRWKGRTLTTFKKMMEPYQIEICGLEEACSSSRDFILGDSERVIKTSQLEAR